MGTFFFSFEAGEVSWFLHQDGRIVCNCRHPVEDYEVGEAFHEMRPEFCQILFSVFFYQFFDISLHLPRQFQVGIQEQFRSITDFRGVTVVSDNPTVLMVEFTKKLSPRNQVKTSLFCGNPTKGRSAKLTAKKGEECICRLALSWLKILTRLATQGKKDEAVICKAQRE